MQHVFTDWATGTPTHPGWFSASRERRDDMLRFWDGARWSVPVPADDCPGDAADRTADAPPDPRGADMIEWRDWRPEWLAWVESETNAPPTDQAL